ISDDNNTIKGHVIYIDHFGKVVVNVTKSLFNDVSRGRNYEIILNEKLRRGDRSNIKAVRSRYWDAVSSSKYTTKDYEGAKLAIFNEAGYLEIALFRSNPSSVGTASSLLGIGYRDLVTIEFINE